MQHKTTELTNTTNENWYALRTNPRAEKKVAERLIQAGFHAYLPLVTTLKIWSDRKKKVQTPLIPSFVFVKTTPTELFNTLSIPGAANVLRYLGKPAIVRNEEIENLKILMNDAEQVTPCHHLNIQQGEEVEVIRGPFVGLTAHAVQVQGKYRIIVNIAALGAAFNVNIPLSFVQPQKLRATA